jgi:outer membrane protein
MKRVLVFLLLNLACLLGVYGQQLTRFAVVDLSKVYTAYCRESTAVRQWEERSQRVQAEVDRRTAEITQLRSQKAAADLDRNQAESSRLEAQIYNMTEALRTYYQTQTQILEDRRRNLMQSGSFLDQIYEEIRFLAESEGCSLVFNLKDTPGIVWYSATVDLTDRLIQNLQTRTRR